MLQNVPKKEKTFERGENLQARHQETVHRNRSSRGCKAAEDLPLHEQCLSEQKLERTGQIHGALRAVLPEEEEGKAQTRQ